MVAAVPVVAVLPFLGRVFDHEGLFVAADFGILILRLAERAAGDGRERVIAVAEVVERPGPKHDRVHDGVADGVERVVGTEVARAERAGGPGSRLVGGGRVFGPRDGDVVDDRGGPGFRRGVPREHAGDVVGGHPLEEHAVDARPGVAIFRFEEAGLGRVAKHVESDFGGILVHGRILRVPPTPPNTSPRGTRRAAPRGADPTLSPGSTRYTVDIPVELSLCLKIARGEPVPVPDVEAFDKRLLDIVRFCMGRMNALRRRVGSDDLRSEVKYALIHAVPTFRGETEAEFWTFVRSIVSNVYVDAQRAEGAQKRDLSKSESLDERPISSPEGDAESAAIVKEELARTEKLIESLPPAERDAMTLVMKGFSRAEIAAKLKIGEDAVRQRISRARKSLAELRKTSRPGSG